MLDLNQLHLDPQSNALPNELILFFIKKFAVCAFTYYIYYIIFFMKNQMRRNELVSTQMSLNSKSSKCVYGIRIKGILCSLQY